MLFDDVELTAAEIATLVDDYVAAARRARERYDVARVVPRWEELLIEVAG